MQCIYDIKFDWQWNGRVGAVSYGPGILLSVPKLRFSCSGLYTSTTHLSLLSLFLPGYNFLILLFCLMLFMGCLVTFFSIAVLELLGYFPLAISDKVEIEIVFPVRDVNRDFECAGSTEALGGGAWCYSSAFSQVYSTWNCPTEHLWLLAQGSIHTLQSCYVLISVLRVAVAPTSPVTGPANQEWFDSICLAWCSLGSVGTFCGCGKNLDKVLDCRSCHTG